MKYLNSITFILILVFMLFFSCKKDFQIDNFNNEGPRYKDLTAVDSVYKLQMDSFMSLLYLESILFEYNLEDSTILFHSLQDTSISGLDLIIFLDSISPNNNLNPVLLNYIDYIDQNHENLGFYFDTTFYSEINDVIQLSLLSFFEIEEDSIQHLSPCRTCLNGCARNVTVRSADCGGSMLFVYAITGFFPPAALLLGGRCLMMAAMANIECIRGCCETACNNDPKCNQFGG